MQEHDHAVTPEWQSSGHGDWGDSDGDAVKEIGAMRAMAAT